MPIWQPEPGDTPAVVDAIIVENELIRDNWAQVDGWAPKGAADMLAKSRLDWQASLSHCLRLWLEPPGEDDADGRLILAWVTLGALVEGTMKFFLSVYLGDYRSAPVMRKERAVDPDVLDLEHLRQFFRKRNVWADESETDRWDPWIIHIQQRRNAIHAYEDRDIGTRREFEEDLRRYLEFLKELAHRTPWPEF